MKQSKEKPPIYEACHEKFGVEWNQGIIFTYGDTIHCRFRVPKWKIEHEKVHIKQQKIFGAARWWGKYLADEKFRLEQELEAYTKEIAWIKSNIRDLAHRKILITSAIQDLSSPIYGNIITFDKAKKLLNER